ncbi:hypothetical protein BJ987_004452 [Nocardia goodfellowii]|uniref:Uncharacterized protein n=1 Tax=Nocardia goodfellowii TaxID=882446 RepID=A0ABS4QIL4_9NOCA|nr:hypothetical protein [Nocardia goodfellowii]
MTITALPAGGYSIMGLPGLVDLAPLIFGGLIIGLGTLLWARPPTCTLAGLLVVLLGLGAFVFANLGGYLLGSLLSIIGGSLGHAWAAAESTSPPG